MRYWLFILLLALAGTAIAGEEIETSPCPGLVSVYGNEQIESALVVTDDVFSSIEDCEMIAAFLTFKVSNRNHVTFDLSSVDDIVKNVKSLLA